METRNKERLKEHPSLLVPQGQVNQGQLEWICQGDDQEIFILGPAVGSCCKSEPQEVVGTNVKNVRSAIKEEPSDDTKETLADTLVASIKQERVETQQEDCYDQKCFFPGTAGSFCKSEPQEVFGANTIKQESMEGREKADPSLFEALDHLHSIKQEMMCQVKQEDCQDQEQLVAVPAAASCAAPESNVRGARPAIKWKPGVWTNIQDNDELMKEDPDLQMDCSGSNPPHPGYVDSGPLGPECRELNIEDEGTLVNGSRNITLDHTYKLVCGDMLPERVAAWEHKKIYSGFKPYECSICNHRFNTKSYLNQHVSRHLELKPFQCSVCSKCFSTQLHLADHTEIHVGVKPFRCNVCSESFSLASSLNMHCRTHPGYKPHECKVCGEHFMCAYQLTTHDKIHLQPEPHQCKVCDKSFRNKFQLATHNRVHSGLKPYQCSICDKQFLLPSQFSIHRRIHTGVRPYQCNVCNKRFICPSFLSMHKRVHSRLKPNALGVETITV